MIFMTTSANPENVPTEESLTQATAEIDLEHDLADVWQALVDPEGLANWMGANTTIEPTTGGELYSTDVVTGEPKRGVITEVDEEHRLSFDWWPVNKPEQVSQVTFVLIPSRRGTLVTVTETVEALGAIRAVHNLVGAQQWRLALLSVATRPSLVSTGAL